VRTKDGLELRVAASPDPAGWLKLWLASYEQPGSKNVDWTIPGIGLVVSKKIAKTIKTAGTDYATAFNRLAEWHGSIDGHPACLKRFPAAIYEQRRLSGFQSFYAKCGGRAAATLYDVGAMPDQGAPVIWAVATAATPAEDKLVRRILAGIR